MKKRVRLYSCFAIVLLVLCFVVSVAVANDRPNIVGYDTYVVSEGDTLWSIASSSNGYGDIDTRDIVHDIRDASNLPTADVWIGDVVQIPIYE